MTILLGGLRELIAATVEAGRDVETVIDAATEATRRLLGPRPLSRSGGPPLTTPVTS